MNFIINIISPWVADPIGAKAFFVVYLTAVVDPGSAGGFACGAGYRSHTLETRSARELWRGGGQGGGGALGGPPLSPILTLPIMQEW
jgi:hypothetical protein